MLIDAGPVELLDYEQASRFLAMTKGTLYGLVSQKRIPHYRLGPRMVRFDKAELISWIKARTVPSPEHLAASHA